MTKKHVVFKCKIWKKILPLRSFALLSDAINSSAFYGFLSRNHQGRPNLNWSPMPQFASRMESSAPFSSCIDCLHCPALQMIQCLRHIEKMTLLESITVKRLSAIPILLVLYAESCSTRSSGDIQNTWVSRFHYLHQILLSIFDHLLFLDTRIWNNEQTFSDSADPLISTLILRQRSQ